MLIQTSFQKPCFKQHIFVEFQQTGIAFYDNQKKCFIETSPENLQETVRLFQFLQKGGLSILQLCQACPELSEQIPELITEFEQRGLLTETPSHSFSTLLSGEEFYQDFTQFLHQFNLRLPPSQYTEKMQAGSITRNQLIGYALESYHITHLCPSLLAPALTKSESLATRKLLREFFASELHHDRLIENSLKSVGITATQLEQMQPLPMTFAVCTSLAVFAEQHPLSFKAALLLFEIHDERFHQLFKQSCEALELPTDFVNPILLHAKINDDGDHENITEILLSEIAYVSLEEQLLVKKNMVILIESMMKRTQEILEYYSLPENPIPRCFD
ncbi:MAG: iron-containing redox enzyme family protein [Microcoleaceae cyanobacterium]